MLHLNHPSTQSWFETGVKSLHTLLVCVAACVSGGTLAQPTTVLRVTELRSDKVATATALTALQPGAELTVMGIEGGWAQVQLAQKPGQRLSHSTGWVRASAIKLNAQAASASLVQSGRQASGNSALTLGVRSLPARINRHALIIGVGKYADPAIPSLPGTKHDKHSATQMAAAMQVPPSNISYLQDAQATGDAIRKALNDLSNRVQDGDRVFIHYSGHGTRYNDPKSGGCIEALLAYDGGASGTITNREMADLLRPITFKTDKLFVMYDSCHSGGLVAPSVTVRSRGLFNTNDDGALRPKYSNITEECGRPVNMKTRNLTVEQVDKGALPQDIVHLSAARHNEMSFDDEQHGGLATQFMRDCMLREAKDLDGSGAISMDEIRQCAQVKIDQRMRNDASFKPHTLLLSGNPAFVPAWFNQPVVAVAAAAASLAPAVAPVDAPTGATGAEPAAAAAPPPRPPELTGEQAIAQMFEQRDAKRQVKVTAAKTTLKIKEDAFDFTVESDRAGHVYVALAGSDNQSVYLLFPNELDKNNRIEAGAAMKLPRPNWLLRAAGPAGKDTLLVIVADGPRDLSELRSQSANQAGPFVKSLNDSAGRAQLGALLSTSATENDAVCRGSQRKSNTHCSDAYGAAVISLNEVN